MAHSSIGEDTRFSFLEEEFDSPMRYHLKTFNMKSTIERLGEILIAIMVIFFFIWFGGFFVGAGKLDWWAESFITAEAAFGIIFMIISLIAEIFNKKK